MMTYSMGVSQSTGTAQSDSKAAEEEDEEDRVEHVGDAGAGQYPDRVRSGRNLPPLIFEMTAVNSLRGPAMESRE